MNIRNILYSDVKQDIDGMIQLELFSQSMNISNKSIQNTRKLLTSFGYMKVFGRTEVIRALGITATPVFAL